MQFRVPQQPARCESVAVEICTETVKPLLRALARRFQEEANEVWASANGGMTYPLFKSTTSSIVAGFLTLKNPLTQLSEARLRVLQTTSFKKQGSRPPRSPRIAAAHTYSKRRVVSTMVRRSPRRAISSRRRSPGLLNFPMTCSRDILVVV